MSDRELEVNSFEFEGSVAVEPTWQTTGTGHTKGVLKVTTVKRWSSGGENKSKDITVPFEFFAKAADKVKAQNLRAGTLVRVAFNLDGYKDYPKLQGWRVDVRSQQGARSSEQEGGMAENDSPPLSDPSEIDPDEIQF